MSRITGIHLSIRPSHFAACLQLHSRVYGQWLLLLRRGRPVRGGSLWSYKNRSLRIKKDFQLGKNPAMTVLSALISATSCCLTAALPADELPDHETKAIMTELEKVDKAWATTYWTEERLSAEADLVVIAEFVDTKPTIGLASERDELADQYGAEVKRCCSEFKVLGILKDSKSGVRTLDRLPLLHFLWVNEDRAHFNTPHLLAFYRVGQEATDSIPKSPNYPVIIRKKERILLFLREKSDGTFEPVSSQFHPRLSVRKIVRIENG